MPRLRIALAFVALAISVRARAASALDTTCANAFWSPSTGTCGFTGRTQGDGSCICEYDCDSGDGQWFDFCEQ